MVILSWRSNKTALSKSANIRTKLIVAETEYSSLADVDADRWFSFAGKGHFYWFGDPEANWTN